jgi:hypothetical protein
LTNPRTGFIITLRLHGGLTVRELLEKIAEKEDEITKLQEDITALKRAAEILGLQKGHSSIPLSKPEHKTSGTPKQNNGNASGANSKFGPKWTKSIGDASEEILREAGPLHIEELHQRLHAQCILPTLGSLDSALRKDGKERFKLYGKRVYGLK